MNNLSVSILIFSFWCTACAQDNPAPGEYEREPVIGLPCEGCEAVFEGLPDTLVSTTRIAPPDEPGEPMHIAGTVYDSNMKPAAGVIVYAYHTDAGGIYPRDENYRGRAAYRHGKLRAWVKTDSLGRYNFQTIRPASYPSTRIPAHVHMHIIEPGRCTYYINSIHFTDDPFLSEEEKQALADGRGGGGLCSPEKDTKGAWKVKRDILLGKNIPGYPAQER